ncbi:M28 family metallopeptidase [Hamadaea tsunoensis]|uniref:M28 family metallopeptidase n=1 Tax=Hamadaea tsunoensis TaxID=53368 RepID=UPI0009FFC221|nr:M28 family peptidase [Hamadaea tsunoensis]
MRRTVTALAADAYAGRRVGTPGGRAAADHLADRLRDLGAVVVLDEFAVTGSVREVYATPTLTIRDRDGSRDLMFRREFCEHLATADVPTPRAGRLARFGDKDVSGAWVLDSGFSAERVASAYAAGAAGVLLPRGTDGAGWMPKMIAGPAPVGLPVLAVRADLHEGLATSEAVVSASTPVRPVDVTGVNVLATFRAPAPGRLSVLLTAHFDGVGDDPDGVRFPAACDNASGVAAVLEAARVLHTVLPLEVGLAVALLDAEEAGAYGSAHHARFVEEGTFVINLDGAAQLADAAHVQAGGPSRPLLTALDLAGREVGVPLVAAAMPSDNRRYAAAGLPAVGIGMGMPGYQTPAETPDRVDDATLDRAARLVVGTVANLARSFNGVRGYAT